MRINIDKIVYPGRRLGLARREGRLHRPGASGRDRSRSRSPGTRKATPRRGRSRSSSPRRRGSSRGAPTSSPARPTRTWTTGSSSRSRRARSRRSWPASSGCRSRDLGVTPSPERLGLPEQDPAPGPAGGRRGPLRLQRARRAGLVRDRRPVPPRPRPGERSAGPRLRGIIEGGPFASVEAVEVRTSRARGESLAVFDLSSGAEAAALGAALARGQEGVRAGRGRRVGLRREEVAGRAPVRAGLPRGGRPRTDLPHRRPVLLPDQRRHPRARLRRRRRGGRRRRRERRSPTSTAGWGRSASCWRGRPGRSSASSRTRRTSAS